MRQTIFAIAGATLLEARRTRLWWVLAALGAVALAGSAFVRELALTESAQLQAAMLAVMLRLGAVALVAGFVVASMVREANDKGDQMLLALPIPRAAYLLAKLLGFALVALAPALVAGALAALLAPADQALLWALSLLCELWIVAAFSLLCAISVAHLLPALAASAAFYLLARSLASLQLLGHASPASRLLDAIGFLLPNLGVFARTEWLLYHTGGLADLLPVLAQTTLYVVLLTALALCDLYRKVV
jgi:ABC-type transport system involved in multi-copper enzyme maturation permease subunit